MNRKLRVRNDRAAMARKALIAGGYLEKDRAIGDLTPLGGEIVSAEAASSSNAAIHAAVDANTPAAVLGYRAAIASLLVDLVYLTEKEKLKIPDSFLALAASNAREIITAETGPGWIFG
ncbi:MAG TPA: hypothetical protein VKY89_11505 [Thermoanaerobaculia bacterium]|jgi:hypothetical protein|nr:hypothetical protein [Thermoanaerobaculia bacterium]